MAYLTHSKYGRNGHKVTINNYYSGSGELTKTGHGGTSDEATYTNIYNEYTSSYGQLASSTGNYSGIYDLNGGSYEYVAAFNNAATVSLVEGDNFARLKGKSNKYATAYSNTTSTSFGNYTVGDVSHVGDAMREVKMRADYAW